MNGLVLTAVSFSVLVFSSWGTAYKWGALDTDLLDEQSGMAASRQFTNRLYHNNDSSGGPFFYTTDLKGEGTKEIEVKNWDPEDVEDMLLGKYSGKQCLFLADIGDNDEERDSVKFAVIEEVETFPSKITPLKVFSAQYPDEPHNAEATVMDTVGNLFVFTKETDGPSKVYRISMEEIRNNSDRKTFEYWGKINVSESINSPDALITSAALSKDGKTLLLLTYHNMLELTVDMSKGLEISKVQTIKLHNLIQQESVAFLPDETGFLYSTEAVTGSAKIWRVDR